VCSSDLKAIEPDAHVRSSDGNINARGRAQSEHRFSLPELRLAAADARHRNLLRQRCDARWQARRAARCSLAVCDQINGQKLIGWSCCSTGAFQMSIVIQRVNSQTA